MIKSRYKVNEQYLIHDKWLATVSNFLIRDIAGLPVEIAGFLFDDPELHSNDKVHGFPKYKDGLYYFSNDASIVESVKTIRNNKIDKLFS